MIIPVLSHQKSFEYGMHVFVPLWNYVLWRFGWIRISILRLSLWEITGVLSILVLIIKLTR
jgi:hypothetical protein